MDLPPEPKLGIFGDASSIGSKYVSQAVSLCMILANKIIL